MIDTDVVLHALNVLCAGVASTPQSVTFDEVDCVGGAPQQPLSITDLTHFALCSVGPRTDVFQSFFLDPKDVSWTAEHLDPRYDYNFSNVKDSQKYYRGAEEYTRPIGWQRFALKVLDKYEGNTWLGTKGRVGAHSSVSGEWPVSFHGTQEQFVKAITEENFKAGHRQVHGPGIYSTPDFTIAEGYATRFNYNGHNYKVIMQNRINPEIREIYRNNKYWLIPVPDKNKEREIVKKAIRPYGVLLKEV